MGSSKNIVDFIKNTRHYIALLTVFLCCLIFFSFAYLFESKFTHLIGGIPYLTWHNMFELTSIVVSFAVFIVSHYTYDQTRNLRSVFLGNIFLATGIIDLFHTLSYMGMPEFFVLNNDANRATTLWIISSLLGAIGYVAVASIPFTKESKINKLVFLIPTLLIGLITLVIATYYPYLLPPMYDANGLTKYKIGLEYLVIILFAVTIIMQIFEYKKTKDFLTILFCSALLVRGFGQFAFTIYDQVYDIYNYIGHVFKFVAFFIVFRVIFIYNVQKPYIELYKAKNYLGEYAKNLDKIVDKRTEEIKQINQRLLEDLEYARDIQKAMLPQSLPKDDGVLFEARYFPAERVSGDFYNVIKLDEQNIALYIGDVSGHGVAAAMLTVFVNQSIKATKETADKRLEIIKPSMVLKDIYKSFNKANFKEEVYMVMLYAVYNISTKELTYASAGMNVPPLIIGNSKEVEEIKIKGFPICKFMEYYSADYSDTTIKLSSGHKIIFYTDGLIDAQNKDKERFLEYRLKTILSNNYRQSGTMLANTIVKDIFDFTGPNKINDDITFFIMQVN